jgi:mRNA interferase MazF
MRINIPDRGDIVVLNFSPVVGHEQGGKRPAIVLSDADFNCSGMAFMCPITSTERGHFFEVKIKTEKTFGVALVAQLTSIDFLARKAKVVDKVDVTALEELIDKVKIILG